MEGLAQRIVAGEVPESLKGRRLVTLDLSSIMGGTAVRGSFEEKIRALLQDLEDEKGNIIVSRNRCEYLKDRSDMFCTHSRSSTKYTLYSDSARQKAAWMLATCSSRRLLEGCSSLGYVLEYL